jgi:hypothetical protein
VEILEVRVLRRRRKSTRVKSVAKRDDAVAERALRVSVRATVPAASSDAVNLCTSTNDPEDPNTPVESFSHDDDHNLTLDTADQA